MTKLASTPSANLDAAVGVGKVTEGMKEMQDAARLGDEHLQQCHVGDGRPDANCGTDAIADAGKKTQAWVVSWNTLGRVVMTQFIVRGP